MSGSEFFVADNCIGGEFVPPTDGKYMDIISPCTKGVIGKVALSTPEDIQRAVEVSSEAFQKWGRLPVKRRVAPLLKLRQLIEEHYDEIANIIVLEHGKNFVEAKGSVQKGNDTVEYACSMPQLIGGRVLEVSAGVECKELRIPLGVCASIVPFNFPAMVPLWTLPICVATGNTIIMKPSEKVPLTMNKIQQLINKAGFPPGVVQTINGAVPAVNALCDHPEIKGLTFVGSTRVAKIVAKRCRSLDPPKRVLALGGAKNHLVSMPDCDLKMASGDIVNSFSGSTGQRCMAASVLITVGDQPELLNAVVEEASKRHPGVEARDIGPVIDQAACSRIRSYIDQAERFGAKILLDGRNWTSKYSEGYYVGPTIILHSNPNDAALHEEIFGPVLSVLKVDSREEAAIFENANQYGNAATVYTSRGEHAEFFQQYFSAGMIGVNIGVPVPREPFAFGGINASKFGDFDITADGGIEFFTMRKKITSKWTEKASGDTFAIRPSKL